MLKLLSPVMTMARGLSVEMMSVANKGTLKTTLANMEGFLEGIVEFQFNFFLVQRVLLTLTAGSRCIQIEQYQARGVCSVNDDTLVDCLTRIT